MPLFEKHLQRHHNPGLHMGAAVCAAAGVLLLARAGYSVIAVLVGVIVLLNLAHAAAEVRHPHYRRQWAEQHFQHLRERTTRELRSNGDAE